MITWAINSMLVKKQLGDLQNVVYIVDWTVLASDGTNEARVGGSTELSPPSGDFTPYANLTEVQVVGWVQAALGAAQVTAIEDNLTGQLAYMTNPPVEAPPLPWQAG